MKPCPWLFLLAWLLPLAAAAQLSPGKLALPHQQLEGLGKCTSCHELGKPVDGARCLACHTTLAARIREGRGFHASRRVRQAACVSCHSDHHGRDFQLIHWEKGEAGFDHAEAGWKLEGAHAGTDCRACHRWELMDPVLAAARDLNPARSYLGQASDCLACHRDEHQGQLGSDCATCHDARAWTPARFDHDATRFPLTGAHATTRCAACHKPELPRPAEGRFVVDDAPAAGAARFKPLASARCTDCHRDPHEDRLGPDCGGCHSTESFQIRSGSFDHGRTRYPLTGAHRQVACADCHKGAEPARRRPPFPECSACHQDPHGGQFSRTGRAQACADCHDTERFRPSRFGLARHQESRAPLEDAHLAVACDDCHTRPAAAAPVRYDLGGRAFSGQACADCHGDPHGGEARPWMGEDGCRHCHGLKEWRGRSFDHERTEFRLRGRHAAVECGACHRVGAVTDPIRVPLKGLSRDCAGCHADPHRAQFATAERGPDCASCHQSTGWRETRFSHDESRFPLDGRHRDLACAACHRPEQDAEGHFIRYRPLGIRCEDCHGPGAGGS